MQKLILLSLLITTLVNVGMAQNYSDDYAINKGNGMLFKLSYGAHRPSGDLADRFGNHFSIGSGLDLLLTEQNWIAGFDFSYYFGSQVNEDVLANLRTNQGFIIGNDRSYADIQLRMRGFYTGVHIGKLISLGFANPRSGIRATVGVGLMQHKIRIQDDPVRNVPQLSNDYKKGYDRLTNGLAFTEFIGYQVLSRNKRVNFYAGFEFTQAFTQNRRDFNFDTMAKDETERLELNAGFRIGWILPFYFGKAADEIYY
jgi:hypothetical protein